MSIEYGYAGYAGTLPYTDARLCGKNFSTKVPGAVRLLIDLYSEDWMHSEDPGPFLCIALPVVHQLYVPTNCSDNAAFRNTSKGS